jgi:two-component system cell cycle response regulator DivK
MTLNLPSSAARGATILYIEDNNDNRKLVMRVLMAEGYRVLEANSASEAVNVIAGRTPDMILMDINMPDVDGYTLTMRFRAMPALKRTPIIALTANVMKGDRERSLEAGCDGYIQKPIDVDALPRQVAKFLTLKVSAAHG